MQKTAKRAETRSSEAGRKTQGELRFWYRYRGLLILPPSLFIAVFPYGEVEESRVLFAVGGVVWLVGMALRVWAQVNLRYRLRVSTVLTATGPYTYVRNPIYIGNTTILLGLCVLCELPWFCPIMLVWCAAVYARVVRYEESHLLRKHGDAYRRYMKRVPRWFPRFRRAEQTREATRDGRTHLLSSVLAELHNVVFLIPVVVKELLYPV